MTRADFPALVASLGLPDRLTDALWDALPAPETLDMPSVRTILIIMLLAHAAVLDDTWLLLDLLEARTGIDLRPLRLHARKAAPHVH